LKRKTNGKADAREFSSVVVDGPDRAPNRSMLRAVGFKDKDFTRSVVGFRRNFYGYARYALFPCFKRSNCRLD
jgi:dihydroxyacid dehydratase/phosphogluconate dehydratase